MPRFKTPDPIAATIQLAAGDARITATDRDDTVVEVHPSNSSHEPDVRAAERTRVEYSAGRLLVKGSRQRDLGLFGSVGSVDVTIELPAGSTLEANAAAGTFRGVGRLGECRVKIATGDIQLDDTGMLDLSVGAGAITVDRVVGDADMSTGIGKVRLRQIDGSAVIKNSNGDCWIGEIRGDLRVSAANGDISVDQAHADITAATANGDVRVGDVTRGSTSLKTACGQIEIGIHPGTAARLDLHTSFGRVRNSMDNADRPHSSDQTIDVRAYTSYGDIVIRRA